MKTKSLWLIAVSLLVCYQVMSRGYYIAGAIILALVAFGLLMAWWYHPSRSAYGRMMQVAVEDYQPEKARKILASMNAATRAEFLKSSEMLLMALQKGNVRGSELLLEMGMDINAFLSPAFSETSVLQTFCMEAEPDMSAIRFLLEHGADPDAGLSYPPMSNALAWGNEELVELLLKHGATPGGMGTSINPSGNTPLHSLCSLRGEKNRERVFQRVKALLDAGADVNALTTAGHSPLDVALEQKYDEDKPIDETNALMPLSSDVIELLQERGAKRGSQLRCPKPRFRGRVLIAGSLPDENQLRYLCREEPAARVEMVNHAWQGEGLGELVDDGVMGEEQKRIALAHTCYIELTMEGEGVVPYELGQRFVRTLCALAQVEGSAAMDFGHRVVEPQIAARLSLCPAAFPGILVRGVLRELEPGRQYLLTEGMEELGFPELACADTERAARIFHELIMPMLLEQNTCLEHNHRAFVSPKFSLVARCEPLGSGGKMLLTITPDFTHYRD